MIYGFYIFVFTTLIGAIIAALPDIPYDQDVTTSIHAVWLYVQAFSWLFPISTLVTVVQIAIAFHLSIFVFDFSLKVYELVRK